MNIKKIRVSFKNDIKKSLFVCAQAEGEDSLKKMQLMELAILNGTYRDANVKSRKNDIINPRPKKQTQILNSFFLEMHGYIGR